MFAAGAAGCGISDLRDYNLGDTVNLAVGQGDLKATPLQLAVAYAAIEMVGAFDTVRALGVQFPLLWMLSEPRYRFHDHRLGPSVRHGFHALALHETRSVLEPLLWASENTGAARIALGPELPALFATDDNLSDAIEDSGRELGDPVWRMPLWAGYDEMLKSNVADLANSAGSPMGGAIVAAIFMQRFLPDGIAWAHLDTFAWRDSAKPGRPKGGEALGLRAVFAALQRLHGTR